MQKLINKLTKNIKGVLFLGTFIVTLSSCHKDVSSSNQIGSNTYATNYVQIFEDFWTSMNKTYVFWSIDKTNWDQVHKDYIPYFAKLDNDQWSYSQSEIAYRAAKLFKQIVDSLVDSHYGLSLTTGYGINPALDRKWNNDAFIGNMFMENGVITALYPDYINYYNVTVDSMYLSSKVVGYDSTSLSPFLAMSGIIKNTHLIYFTFTDFRLLTEYQYGNADVKAAIDNFFTLLNDPTVTGLVLDVRGNGGGETSDLNFLMGRLVSKAMKVGYTRSKSGTGRLDYTPWADAVVKPWAGFSSGFTKPIAVLADGLSASMAELTAMSVKALPNNTYFVGDTTWGANGPLTQNSNFNAGSFYFGNYYSGVESGDFRYYGYAFTSSCMFKYLDNKIYEGKGFPPDYVIKVTPDDIFLLGNVVDDPQLNKAISLLPH